MGQLVANFGMTPGPLTILSYEQRPIMSKLDEELALAGLDAKTRRWLKRKPKKSKASSRRRADEPVAITPIEYGGLQEAYDHFNHELFDGALPDVFITYQRRANSYGYFAADRFAGRVIKAGRHELALNPDGFISKSDKEICSTLVHEQAHVWQHATGTAPKRGYHDKEWAAKMKAIGLQPSSTGMVGGKETGQRMDHYIVAGGAFEQSYDRLAATNWKLNLESAHRPGEQKGPSSKTKFTCSSCRQNAWGKPDLAIICKPCGIEMLSAEALDRTIKAA